LTLGLLGAARIQAGANPSEIVLKPLDYASAQARVQGIQAAINSLAGKGGTIYLAAGTWLLQGGDKAITLDEGRSAIRFRGDGDATVIKQDTALGLSSNIFYLNNATGIAFQDLRFEGPRLKNLAGDGQYHTAIQADGGSGIHVLRCSFQGFKTGAVVYQGGIARSDVLDCTFDRVDNRFAGDYGAISLGSAADILIRGNLFLGLRFSGISVSGKGYRLSILDNIMRFDMGTNVNGTMGIYVTEGLQDCLIAGNQIYGPHNEALDLRTKASIGITTQGNIIANNIMESKYVGVALNNYDPTDPDHRDTWHNIIQGNVIAGLIPAGGAERVDHGILSKQCNAAVIQGNVFNRSTTGINLQDSPTENTVAGNLIADAGSSAAFVPGSAIVSRNMAADCGSGIAFDWARNSESRHTSVVGNFFPGTSPRLNQGPNVAGAAVWDNCDQNGNCD
jgi:parallel beta-helix repeat protein